MKQFSNILKFELAGYLKNKAFVGITLFLVAAIVICMFLPNITAALDREEDTTDGGEKELMLIYTADPELADLARVQFTQAFPNYQVAVAEGEPEDVQNRVISGEAQCAFALESITKFTYYVNNLSMYDTNLEVANEVMEQVARVYAMYYSGLTEEQVSFVLGQSVESETVALGKDQMQNFFYTYIMIFALYMVILLYGQMVATNVASEKSSRAMELLITSADPTAMMFGKVLASCLAGLIQLVAVFGTAVLLYHVNRDALSGNVIITSIFDIPLNLFGYLLLFFVLGYLIYAFLYGAMGSTVSKLEDVNTAVTPITFLFIAAFFVVMFSMIGGSVDTPLMVACSYIPFTSPMAMFTRICMSTVAWYEIAISVAILIGSTIGIGLIAARIYRVGVLLYGNKLNISTLVKLVLKK